MKKTIIIFIIILIIIITLSILVIFLKPNLTGKSIENQEDKNYYTYTKAICNSSNYCQDNEITCQDNQVISITPLTGAVVQFDSNWKDPRDEETKEKLC